MSFRRRITFASAAAVAIAVLLASVLVYLLTSNELHGQVDAQLRNRSDNLRLIERHPTQRHGDRVLDALQSRSASAQQLFESGPEPPGNALGNVSPRPNQVRGYQQLVDSSGKVLFRSGAKNVTLPVDARTRALAAGRGESFFRDATVNGLALRILAEHLAPGRVVQFAQPLAEVNQLLSHLRLILVLLSLGGILLAALLGQLVARAAVQPVRRLTRAAEHVAETQDLSGRIAPTGDDEIGRLAVNFNAMLDALETSMAALDASVHAQRQLVADASHELRTPVTSLRTNIEILQHAPDMDGSERERLLEDVVEQIGELTLLMNDLIDLARDEEQRADAEDVRLDIVVQESLARAQRNSPATPLRTTLQPVLLSGVAARLDRAVANLIDNAIKHSPAGEPVEIALTTASGGGGELTVRDHGPGISAEDLPHVFDRFYRGAEARGRPGSGLGLAIVRQVIAQHGGTVTAERAPGGGTLMRVTLPGVEPLDQDGPRETAAAVATMSPRVPA
ncbi:MAG TPA: HAMP domain-containing sensor histidine kinase [Solirubrobacteraceae bacterium]|jgi:two-component system sensor histidine kinase MprB|nr:HAMP domain-containing sensor histidine kinase [Solirubrobacteraceae bacterium]